MKNKFHLILALACVLCFSTSLVAQDLDKPEKPKAAKKAKRRKGKKAPYANLFGGAELTDAQKTQLAELASTKNEEMTSIRKSVSELVTKENAKTIRFSIRKSTRGGMDPVAAQKAAWEEVGLSAEDQAKLTELQKQRSAIEKTIVTDMVATFSEEQKEAMKAGPKKGKKGAGKGGKKKKGKGKKGKDKEKAEKKAEKETEE